MELINETKSIDVTNELLYLTNGIVKKVAANHKCSNDKSFEQREISPENICNTDNDETNGVIIRSPKYSSVISSVMPVSHKTQDVEIISIEAPDSISNSSEKLRESEISNEIIEPRSLNFLSKLSLNQALPVFSQDDDVQINTFSLSSNQIRKQLAPKSSSTKLYTPEIRQYCVPTYSHNSTSNNLEKIKNENYLTDITTAAASAASATIIATQPIFQAQKDLEQKLTEVTKSLDDLKKSHILNENSERVRKLENQLDDMLSKRLEFIEQLQIEHYKSIKMERNITDENVIPIKYIAKHQILNNQNTPKKSEKTSVIGSEESLLSTPSPKTNAPRPIKIDKIERVKSVENINNNCSNFKTTPIKNTKLCNNTKNPVIRANKLIDTLKDFNDSIKDISHLTFDVNENNNHSLSPDPSIDSYFINSNMHNLNLDLNLAPYKLKSKSTDVHDTFKTIVESRNRMEKNFETLFVRCKPDFGDLSEKQQIMKQVDCNIMKIKPQIDQYVKDCLDGNKIVLKNNITKSYLKRNYTKSEKSAQIPVRLKKQGEILKTDKSQLKIMKNQFHDQHFISSLNYINQCTQKHQAIALCAPRKNTSNKFQNIQVLSPVNHEKCVTPIHHKTKKEKFKKEASLVNNKSFSFEDSDESNSSIQNEKYFELVGFQKPDIKKSSSKSAVIVEKKSSAESTIIAELRKRENVKTETNSWIKKEVMLRILNQIRCNRQIPVSKFNQNVIKLEKDKKTLKDDVTVGILGKSGIRMFVDTGCPVAGDLVRNLIRDVIKNKLHAVIENDNKKNKENMKQMQSPEVKNNYIEDFDEDDVSNIDTPTTSPRLSSKLPTPRILLRTPEITPNVTSDESIEDLDDVDIVKSNGILKSSCFSVEPIPLKINNEYVQTSLTAEEIGEAFAGNLLMDVLETPKQTPINSPDIILKTPSFSESIENYDSTSLELQTSINDGEKSIKKLPETISIDVQTSLNIKSEKSDYNEENEYNQISSKSSISSETTSNEKTETIGEIISDGQWILDKSEGEAIDIALESTFPKLDLSFTNESYLSDGEYPHSSKNLENDVMLRVIKEQWQQEIHLPDNIDLKKKLKTQGSIGEIDIDKSKDIDKTSDYLKQSVEDYQLSKKEEIDESLYSVRKEDTIKENKLDYPNDKNISEMFINETKPIITPKKILVENRPFTSPNIFPTGNTLTLQPRRRSSGPTIDTLNLTSTFKQKSDPVGTINVDDSTKTRRLLNTVELLSTDEQSPIPSKRLEDLKFLANDLSLTDKAEELLSTDEKQIPLMKNQQNIQFLSNDLSLNDETESSELPEALKIDDTSSAVTPIPSPRRSKFRSNNLKESLDSIDSFGIRSSLKSRTEMELQFGETISSEQLIDYQRTLEEREVSISSGEGYDPSANYLTTGTLSPK